MHALHPAAAIRFGWTLVCDTCFPCWLEAVNRILTLRALGGSACCRCGTVRMCVAKANPLLFRLWAGRVALAVARCEFCVVDASPRRALGGSGRSCCGAARILRSRSEPSPGFARVEPLLLWHGAKSAWSMALVGSLSLWRGGRIAPAVVRRKRRALAVAPRLGLASMSWALPLWRSANFPWSKQALRRLSLAVARREFAYFADFGPVRSLVVKQSYVAGSAGGPPLTLGELFPDARIPTRASCLARPPALPVQRLPYTMFALPTRRACANSLGSRRQRIIFVWPIGCTRDLRLRSTNSTSLQCSLHV